MQDQKLIGRIVALETAITALLSEAPNKEQLASTLRNVADTIDRDSALGGARSAAAEEFSERMSVFYAEVD